MKAPHPTDAGSSAGLLLVSLVTVMVGVAAVIAVAKSTTSWSVAAALLVLLIGLTLVMRTMSRQLGDDDGFRDEEHP